MRHCVNSLFAAILFWALAGCAQPQKADTTPPAKPDETKKTTDGNVAAPEPKKDDAKQPAATPPVKAEVSGVPSANGDVKSAPVPETPAVPKTPEPPAAARRMQVAVPGLFESAETPLGTVDVAFVLPAGWSNETAYGPNRYGPKDVELAFGFDAGCNGNCDPGSIPENLAKAFDGFKEMAGRPNLNTGDPAKDAVRATVETLADQQLTNGKALALRITYSPEIMASGPYQAEMRLMCAWHQPGDPWYVQLSVRAAQKQGEEALPTLLDVCKSVEVLGPTPNEAEKQPAQTFTGERLALAALPPSAYSVESKNSEGQPAAILLKQPVVYNGLPIAPIAKIYLDYGDEPTTFRDIFTTKDHTFTVAGASVVCLRRQPLSVRPDGGLHRCMLAQDTKVGEWMFKAYGEVSFEAQRPRSGVLKDQVSFPEATCQAASKVEFDAADGGLTRCTLGQPLVKEGLSVPIGAEVRWKGVARIDRIEIPKEAVLQVGTDSYTGPGQARFKQGVFLEWRAGK